MSDELRALCAFALAGALALILVPVARRVAIRTGFLDHPVDYKAHASATPYLGGAGVIAAFTPAAIIFGSGAPRFWLILGLALALVVIGSIDDRRTLPPALRFGSQLLAGAALYAADVRWEVSGSAWLDLPITLLWVAGLANAFNLLDNIDGAAATTASVSAAGIGALALARGEEQTAAVAFALSGACLAFLVFNLARPARLFLGDGGSVPIGFLVAALALVAAGSLGGDAVLVAVPLAGVAIFDTTLVVLSRTRRGISILTGGRDHTTHRLLGVFGDTRRVAAFLAAGQALLCCVTLLIWDGSERTVALAAIAYVIVGALLLAFFERPALAPATAPKEQSV